jgi:hypothetical protein
MGSHKGSSSVMQASIKSIKEKPRIYLKPKPNERLNILAKFE